MNNKKKKAFTLVELLAVIVILAVILVIAIPQIINVIKTARMSSIKDSAMLIAEQAEKDYLSQQVLNQEYNAKSIDCSDVVKLNNDYNSCKITYNNGVARVKLKGKENGKFSGITCSGTKDNMNCKEREDGYTDAVEYFANLYNNGSNSVGLIQTNGTELRYQGSNPNNYVTFNGEEAGWRIVGVFDGRIKLVRKKSLGNYSWDTSKNEINGGCGINEWSKSYLMNELNGDYLDLSLTSNTTWYNGRYNNTKTATFTYTNRLSNEAQDLIDDAVWYLGGINIGEISLEEAYTYERGSTTCQRANTVGCMYAGKNDGVERTLSWTGKVGLIYPSDYGYASSNSNCKTNIRTGGNCDSNWMASYGWTISQSSSANHHARTARPSYIYIDNTYATYEVHPSVYLVSKVQVKGTGTSGDPFVFAE